MVNGLWGHRGKPTAGDAGKTAKACRCSRGKNDLMLGTGVYEKAVASDGGG